MLDLWLYGQTRLDLVEELVALRAFPVVVCTAEASDFYRTRALDSGAKDYIVTPVLPEELLDRLRRTFETWRVSDNDGGGTQS